MEGLAPMKAIPTRTKRRRNPTYLRFPRSSFRLQQKTWLLSRNLNLGELE
jgi:hypothetical protein